MPKMTSWQAPLTVRRFKDPSGPLQDIAACLVYDFSKQRPVHPNVIGACYQGRTMNSGGMAAMADVTSLETNGTASPFPAPFRNGKSYL